LDYLPVLLDKGVYLDMERYSGGCVAGTPNWEHRTEVVEKRIDAGHVSRIMLSVDYSALKAHHGIEGQEERRQANPDGYNFIPRDEDIQKMMVENPLRFFGETLSLEVTCMFRTCHYTCHWL
jgi:predicted metal-dependent phosphotriesterase family hydrolase